jgi:hypothetical protein
MMPALRSSSLNLLAQKLDLERIEVRDHAVGRGHRANRRPFAATTGAAMAE